MSASSCCPGRGFKGGTGTVKSRLAARLLARAASGRVEGPVPYVDRPLHRVPKACEYAVRSIRTSMSMRTGRNDGGGYYGNTRLRSPTSSSHSQDRGPCRGGATELRLDQYPGALDCACEGMMPRNRIACGPIRVDGNGASFRGLAPFAQNIRYLHYEVEKRPGRDCLGNDRPVRTKMRSSTARRHSPGGDDRLYNGGTLARIRHRRGPAEARPRSSRWTSSAGRSVVR